MWRALWMILALALALAPASADSDVDDASVEVDPSENIDVNIPGIDKKLPTPGELLKMLDSMDLSEEEKQNIRENIMKSAESLDDVVKGSGSGFLYQALVLLSLLSVLALIFGFFGYKLYKSLVDKEIKREMKRKQREMKKRK
ncbi:uncharacterized protein [Fopius arisanus]|uniref:p69_0 protein n=1 Tax=Fopius arisanus TaxID=64838 RepID=A0A0C9QFM8_9HYME|nr:PREDICTED: uncharacterized protein LOC105270291 [Fopius arisanus]XP_011309444.1 PREDICTED: uncharacterized protein LOC105270291 [Fopius arisanus]XP_011309454.1 PREDICTED: uncharacterized protein LOC105270291 [Fopius arisanus]XP_011309462.1 PREDICTED: uncharacterized protein LOC105270291 [Fopius arisanus]